MILIMFTIKRKKHDFSVLKKNIKHIQCVHEKDTQKDDFKNI